MDRQYRLLLRKRSLNSESGFAKDMHIAPDLASDSNCGAPQGNEDSSCDAFQRNKPSGATGTTPVGTEGLKHHKTGTGVFFSSYLRRFQRILTPIMFKKYEVQKDADRLSCISELDFKFTKGFFKAEIKLTCYRALMDLLDVVLRF